MLADWTPEWNRIALSIVAYVLQKHKQKQRYADPITEYNDWLHWSGLHVPDMDMARWCVKFIQSARACPVTSLTEMAKVDGIDIGAIKALDK